MSSPSQAKTGTWNGPAPRGAGAAALAAPAAAAAVVSEPRSVLLNNGLRIPMMGLGTYQISGASAKEEGRLWAAEVLGGFG
jgi:hypothetical protein